MSRAARVGWVLVLGACASSQDQLVLRRDRIRESNRTLTAAEAPAYRSSEVFRRTVWGMTPQEVAAVRGPADEDRGDLKVYREPFGGVMVASAYLFAGGQLVAVRTSLDRLELSRGRLEANLRLDYGEPLVRCDRQGRLQARYEAARRADAALGLLVLATHPLGMSLWPLGLAPRAELEHAALEAAVAPPYEAVWSTPETSIHLVDADGQRTLVTWQSRKLAALLMAREAGGLDPPVPDLAGGR